MAGIVGANDALHDHGKGGLGHEPLEIGPAQARIRLGVHVLREGVGTLGRVRSTPGVEIRVAKPLGQAERVADVPLAPSRPGEVHRQQDGRVAGGGGALDEAGTHRPLGVHVELEPSGSRGGGGDLFDGRTGQCAERIGDARLRRRPVRGQLPIGMGHPLNGGGRQVNGHPKALPEELVAQLGVVG